MKNNFNDCLQRVLKDEGGYSDDSGDNGGATKYGITIGDVRRYVKKNATKEDVRNLSIDTAKVIYKSKYWDAISADSLPSGVDYTCFDYGVNSGIGRVRKVLNQFKDKSGDALIDAINDERQSFLTSISENSHNTKFRKGWLARVKRVRDYSHILSKKKDNISGPASTAASGLTVWATMSQYIHNHPYIVIGGSIAVASIIGVLIHLYRNK
jgi:lysozyme family protein